MKQQSTSKRAKRAAINVVFSLAAIKLGAEIPKLERDESVKKNLLWVRALKREVMQSMRLAEK
jgi:hypothetical protein